MSALQHSQRAINANFDPPNFTTLNKSLSSKTEKTQVIRSPINETFSNLFKTFKTLINSIFGFALQHFVALYDQLDPIRVEEVDSNNLECRKKFKKFHYVFAFLVSATFDLYGTFGFHLEHGGRITAEEMAASPYTFSHQVSAPLIWAQVDSTWSLNCTTTLVILFLMSVISEVSETFVLCRRGERLYLGGKGIKNDFRKSLHFSLPPFFRTSPGRGGRHTEAEQDDETSASALYSHLSRLSKCLLPP